MSKHPILVYTDGSADNNRSREGGYGVVIRHIDHFNNLHKRNYSGGRYINTTTARMEIIAVKKALEIIATIRTQERVVIHCDNQYVCYSLSKNWAESWIKNNQSKKNMDLWKEVVELFNRCGGHECIEIRWVRGHSGNYYNELADQLANQGRLNKEVEIIDYPC